MWRTTKGAPTGAHRAQARKLPGSTALAIGAVAVLLVGAVVAAGCGKDKTVPPPPTSTPTPSPTLTPSPDASALLTLQSTAAFWSNGDPTEGWYWLRDPQGDAYATWVIDNVYEGVDGAVLDMTVLATDAAGGGRGFDARFYLSYGALRDDGTVDFSPAQLVDLNNTSPADDPVGYTCTGMEGIAFPPFASSRTLVVRITRRDPEGQGATVATHIAVNETSVTPLYGE